MGILFKYGYCYNNKSYFSFELKNLAQCQPAGHFAWGLSSLLVKIVFGVQILWTLAMYAIRLDANLNSALCRNSRKAGYPLQAVSDLAEVMREVLRREYLCVFLFGPGLRAKSGIWFMLLL